MNRTDKILLKVGYPKWFLVVISVVLPLTLIFLFLGLIYLNIGGFTWLRFSISTFFLAIIVLGFWLIPTIYSSILATDSGLQVRGFFGQKRQFTWDEIAKISKPRFGIPRDFAYVISRGGRKIIVMKSWEGYFDLLKLIESKASNLSHKRLPQEVWPKRLSWKKLWLIVIGVLVLYVFIRLIFRF